MKRVYFILMSLLVFISPLMALEFTESKLPELEGTVIRADGKAIVEKNKIASFEDSYGLHNICYTFGIKKQVFEYEGQSYVLLNDGDYKYYLVKAEDWKTVLFENLSNVNVLPVYRQIRYEELIERKLEELIPEMLKATDSYSEIALFTKLDTSTNTVKFISKIFFDRYSFSNSVPSDFEYPESLPEDFYFSVDKTSFINFFNASIENDQNLIVNSYNNNVMHLVEDYDRYEDNTWINCSESYEIITKDNVSLKLYIGKLSSGSCVLRMTAKTMGCDKYYDCIEKVVFVNDANERISIDVPYKYTDYSYSHASFDILLCLNKTEQIDLEKLKSVLSGDKVEIMITLSDSYRRSYKINKAKVSELLFMLNSYEEMIKTIEE